MIFRAVALAKVKKAHTRINFINGKYSVSSEVDWFCLETFQAIFYMLNYVVSISSVCNGIVYIPVYI